MCCFHVKINSYLKESPKSGIELCMEVEDDIFLIYTRTQTVLKKLQEQKCELETQRKEILLTLLSYNPPYGFTKEQWKELAAQHNIPYPLDNTKVTNSPTLTYKEAKEMIYQVHVISNIDHFEMIKEAYESRSSAILEEFKRIIENPIHTDFMSVKRYEGNKELIKLKNDLIRCIMELLGDEVAASVVSQKKNGKLLDPEEKEEDESSCEEEDCEEMPEVEEDVNCIQYTDLTRINFNQKYKYDKRQHFRDTINQYQGLQQKNIPQKVIDDVIIMIKNHGLFDASKTLAEEQFARVTKEHVRMFLEESGHPKSYEDLQLIYHKITTKPCPNIQKYEAALYEDFEQLVEAFLSLPNIDRKNFLNTHYTLSQLLRRRGVVVPENDLNTLKTPARLRAHDDIYQACCMKLGWNFKPLH
jgi:hypothetical protein